MYPGLALANRAQITPLVLQAYHPVQQINHVTRYASVVSSVSLNIYKRAGDSDQLSLVAPSLVNFNRRLTNPLSSTAIGRYVVRPAVVMTTSLR